tara:strand:+ start:8694 stop:9752 length:1059 start_codon:yes stop_codon:yes gene_type:complete
MSRVLNRPLFRKGGSTSGITSGLDKPRQNYKTAGRVDYPAMYEQAEEITEKFYPERDSKRDFGRYLMDFGIELANTEPQGGIFGTASKALRGPTQRFLARGDVQDKTRTEAKSDIFKSLIESEADILSGESSGRLYKDQVMLENLLVATEKKLKLTKKQKEEGLSQQEETELLLANTTINQLRKRDPLVEQFLGSKDVIGSLVNSILPSKKREMVTNEDGDRVLKYPSTPEGQQQMIQDAIIEIREIIVKGGETSLAKGGRVGYQQGSLVEDVSMEEETIEEPMAEMPEADAMDISYDELRQRLPESISDDIVTLLSQSAEALEDFAMIQTQQDVDIFNSKYNVNLVLPQEV